MAAARSWCTVAIGLLWVTSAHAQGVRLFMSADGEQNSQPPSGNTSLRMEPGTMTRVIVFLQNDHQDPDRGLQSYQLVIRDFGAPQGSATGMVSYVAGTRTVDDFRPDFVFKPVPPSCIIDPATVADFPAQMGFAVIETLSPLLCEVLQPPTPRYMMEFDLVASSDACGEFVVEFAPLGDPAAGGSFLLAEGGVTPYCSDLPPPAGNGCIQTLESLTVTVGGNDDCADAQVIGNGTFDVIDACATLDGTECATERDVWFEHTSSCTGTLHVDVAGGAQVGIYAAQACPPAGALACGAGKVDLLASLGDTFLIQVGDGPGDNSGSITIVCIAADCFPNLPPNAPPTVNICCIGASPGQCAGSGVVEPCVNVICDNQLGCVFLPKPAGSPCNDGLVCTVNEQCDGGEGGRAACTLTEPLNCNDFNTCTLDTCVEPGGCNYLDLGGAACTPGDPVNGDAFCQSGGLVTASCDPISSTCTCIPPLFGSETLCLDVRNCADHGAAGICQSDQDCGPAPDGVLQCSDNDENPHNGGVCVDQCCFEVGGEVLVDVELGVTPEPACGAQLYLQYDTASLDLVELIPDPDLEFGWSFVLLNQVNESAGTIDLALALPVGTACNAANGTFTGGTVARLRFSGAAACKTPGVQFRPHNPPTRVSGPKGAMELTGCDGVPFPNGKQGDLPAGTDDIRIAAAPVWSCPVVQPGGAECGGAVRTVSYPPLQVTDACDDNIPPLGDLCALEYFPHCKSDFDCGGYEGTCDPANPAACGGNPSRCVPHPDGTPIHVCALGDCAEETGLCATPVDALGIEVEDFLDCSGGCEFPPGLVTLNCSYTNSCGHTADCVVAVENTGLNRLIVDVELSPTMLPGQPSNPIVRCLEFELSVCDSPAGAETQHFSQEVIIGQPGHIAGHGTAELEIQPGNWTCLTARDPLHTLTAGCSIECDPLEGVYRARFKGSPATSEACHWLVQGDLDGDDHIDIADYTILAGHYLQEAGLHSACPDPMNPPAGNTFHADLNGDGLVTLGDFTFVVFNFHAVSKDPCEPLCGPQAATAAPAARSAISVRELAARGLGIHARRADVNADGVVDVQDISAFLDRHADSAPDAQLKAPLKAALSRLNAPGQPSTMRN